MRRVLLTGALALAGCVQPPRATPVESETASPSLAPRYPHWSAVPAPDAPPPESTNHEPPPPPHFKSQPLIGGATLLKPTLSHQGHPFDLQLIAFDSRDYDLKVIDQPDDWSGGGRITECLRKVGAIAGVNGGFFSPQFTPMGLMIADGHATGSWQPNKLLTGAVVVHDTPRLLWNAEVRNARDARDFIQAGPRLVDAGRAVPNLERRKHTTRTFIATDGGHRWLLGLAHSISLGELAEVLAQPGNLGAFRVQRALNLDGGHSSALYFRTAEGHEHADPGWSTVRNYLGIVPRGQR